MNFRRDIHVRGIFIQTVKIVSIASLKDLQKNQGNKYTKPKLLI